MSRPPWRPEGLAWSVFTTRQGLEAGLSRHQLRSMAWRRLFRGAYADRRLPLDHGLRCRAAALLMPPGAAVAGRSAAWLYGARLARTGDPVEILSPTRFGPVTGIRIRIGELPDEQVERINGVRVTSASRTAWDIAVHNDVVVAVQLLDALLAAGLVKPLDLDDLLAAREWTRGWRKAGRAFRLADGRAESFPESEVRLRLVSAGLPPPVPQFEVRAGAEFVARVDLAWPEHRVALEYDGAHHAGVEQMRRDRRRLNRLVSAGWVVLHVTHHQLRRDFASVIRELRTSLARRKSLIDPHW